MSFLIRYWTWITRFASKTLVHAHLWPLLWATAMPYNTVYVPVPCKDKNWSRSTSQNRFLRLESSFSLFSRVRGLLVVTVGSTSPVLHCGTIFPKIFYYRLEPRLGYPVRSISILGWYVNSSTFSSDFNQSEQKMPRITIRMSSLLTSWSRYKRHCVDIWNGR